MKARGHLVRKAHIQSVIRQVKAN